MTDLPFLQLDVFSSEAFRGNPLAVILNADGLSDAQMAQIANWTNLSETTFLLKPTHPDADYRVRIFTPATELPFAGHPTLGSAHAWLSLDLPPKNGAILQECNAGLIPIRPQSGRLAFAAPPRLRTGPIDPEDLSRIRTALRLAPQDILDAEWVDNGPGFCALYLKDRTTALAIQPDWNTLAPYKVGIVAPYAPSLSSTSTEPHFEIRSFIGEEQGYEDPITGSLNAGIAQWLTETNRAPASYIASQGTALGRAGRIFIDQSGKDIWVGGYVTTRIKGTLTP